MPVMPLPFTAFILAGGLGTRLQPVVSDRPKPMALVDGMPFLEMLLDSLAGKGVRDFVILSGYRGDAIEEALSRLEVPRRAGPLLARGKTAWNRRSGEACGTFCHRPDIAGQWRYLLRCGVARTAALSPENRSRGHVVTDAG